MLYEIKVLKAPWPAGAKVGDVVDMPYLPTWAQGKCSVAQDGAEATIEFVEPVAADGVNRPLTGDGSGQALPSIESISAELERARGEVAAAHDQARVLREQFDASFDAAENDRRKAEAEAEGLRARLQQAEAHAAALQAKLDAAETDEGRAAAAVKAADEQAASERAASEAKAKGKK
ncbi:hypothetical protein LJR039_004360 [Pseudorhodoferax sp. LjRoot39]|uniref:hypothetical protein n=1 Tax=Pseudorhodoferax sp. LjRoot39 TaxID=3342328 RepID=UPI003ECDE3A4